MRGLGKILAALALIAGLAAGAMAQEDGTSTIEQVPLDEARMTRFISSFEAVQALMLELDKEYEPGDADSVLDEIDYLAGSAESVAAIEAKVKEAGFDGFKDWYDTIQSIMIARQWLSEPPTDESMDASEAEIRKMEGITDEEKEDLLAGLREAREQMDAMKPTDANLEAVRPHLDRLDGLLGGSN